MCHKITPWRACVSFVLPGLPYEPATISIEEGAFIAVNNKSQLGLSVKPLIFLPDFNQILIRSTCFNKSTQYKMSRKSIQSETEGRT
jgi:hypothetical protein